MKAAVIGMGSIGKRHYENLINLGVSVTGYDLGDNPGFDHDFVVIATPTDTHVELAKKYLKEGIATFIEKPISENYEELEDIGRYEAFSMVACNLRFTSVVSFMKKVMSASDVLSIRAVVRDSNPSRSKYGDIVLQDIHEFDYLRYLLGEIKDIHLVKSHGGKAYQASVLFDCGATACISGDMISDRYERYFVIQTARHSVACDIDVSNDMYIKQMDYFVSCVKNGLRPMNSIEEAANVTRKIMEAIHRCDNSGQNDIYKITGKSSSGDTWAHCSGESRKAC